MRCMGEYIIIKLFISLLNIYKDVCACVNEEKDVVRNQRPCPLVDDPCSYGISSLHPQKIMDAVFYNMMDVFVLTKHDHVVFLLKRMRA